MKLQIIRVVFMLATLVTILTIQRRLSHADSDKSFWQKKTLADWQKVLTPEQIRVCRQGQTEKPNTCTFNTEHRPGIFRCSSCNLELFKAADKFDSGTGWPSFFEVYDKNNLIMRADYSLMTKRTEVLCRRCNAHLGHVFDDGPPPTHQRYCINSVCLIFDPAKTAPGSTGSAP